MSTQQQNESPIKTTPVMRNSSDDAHPSPSPTADHTEPSPAPMQRTPSQVRMSPASKSGGMASIVLAAAQKQAAAAAAAAGGGHQHHHSHASNEHLSQPSGQRYSQQDFSLTAPSSPTRSRNRSGSIDEFGNGVGESNLSPRSQQLHPQLHQQHSGGGEGSGGNPPIFIRSSTNTPHPQPLSSPGFNGSTAKEFFRSHLRAIAFTARLSHMAGNHVPGVMNADGTSNDSAYTQDGSIGPGEMSESQFTKLAESLGKEESLATLRTMYQSLQQFKNLLVESRTLAGSELQKEETFNRIVTRVRSVIQAEVVLLLMLDKMTDTFYSCATTIPTGQIQYSHNLTHSFCGHVARYKTSLNLKYSAKDDPRYDPDLSKKLGGIRFRSILAVPVFNKNSSITAVILCINKKNSSKSKEQYFSEQDQSLVEFISLLAGHTIENALLFDEAVTRRRQTETLLQITELMAAEVDTNRVMQRMIEASYLLVNAERITLYMIDSEKDELVAQTRGSWGNSNNNSNSHANSNNASGASTTTTSSNNNKPLRFSMSKGILGFCATSGKPVNSMDARKDWRFDNEVDSSPDCPTVSLLVVPVTDHMSKPIAIIQAVNKRVSAPPVLNPITGGSAAQQTSNGLNVPGYNGQNGAAYNGLSPQQSYGGHLFASSNATSSSSSFNGINPPVSPYSSSFNSASSSYSSGSSNNSSGGSAYSGPPSTLHYFTKDEETLLNSMAVSAGVILRKSKLYEEAISTRKKTEALLQISELMSADLQSEKIMSKIVQAAYMLVNAECVLLYMVDEGASELVCEVGKDGSKGIRIPLGHGVAGHTALTGRSLNIQDAQNDWRFDPSEHSTFKNKVQTILCIPVKDYLGKNVGVIEIINKRSVNNTHIVSFSSEDEDVLNSLAYTAGAVLRKSKLFDEAISRRRQTEALLQINEIMSAELGSEKIMQRIIEASYTLVDAERITLFAVDPKTGELVCQVSKDPFFQGVRMSYGHGIVGHVALTRRSLNIVNAYSDPRFNQLSDLKTGYKTHSILTVPVTDRRGQSVAVIQAVNKRGEKSFTPEDVLLLESMAVNAGMLLQKSRLFDAAVVADRKSRALVSLVMTATREDLSTEAIMHEIGRVAYDALCADRVYIFFVDQIQEQLTCVVGPDEEGWTVALGRGIAGYVALTGELVNVEDAFKHTKFDASVDIRGSYKPKSVLCMGVKNNDGEVIAVVYAVNKRSAARHAHMQWNNLHVQHASTPAGSSGGVQSSPLRPQGPPPSTSPIASQQQHNANSNALPPMSGSNAAPGQPTLRKHNSRHSVGGNVSPWHSLRPSFSSGGSQQHGDGGSSSGSGNSADNGVGRISPMSQLPSPMRQRGSSIQYEAEQSLLGSPLTSTFDAHLHGYANINTNSTLLHHQASLHTSHGSSSHSHDVIETFSSEDEEILRALCAEVRSLLIRHVRETILEMNQLSMNEGVYSLMDMYTGVVSSRTALAAATAHAVNQTHQTTSGLPPPGAGAGTTGGKQPLLRPTGSHHRNKRLQNAYANSQSTAHSESIQWPIGHTSKFNDLLSLEFNVWTYTPDDLLIFAYEMFTEMRLLDEFQIDSSILKNFFLTVRSNYHDNPFHNWYHGFSVLHFSYLSLRVLTNASEYLTQHDVLSLMIASLCHDIDHPGNTNSFEINTGSELALIHNDLSVLENHHSYTTFRILRQKSSNILCNLRKDTFQSLKKMIVGAIMATDMISHFTECRNLDKCDTSSPFNIKVPADRQVVVNLLIHSSDLSAQCFPTPIAQVWEERITREFENQAAREKAQGIPVAEFMQNLTNPLLRRQNQVNFIDVVLIPWWRATTRIFSGFKSCYKNLLTNRNYYDSVNHSDPVAPSPESLSSTVNSPAQTRVQSSAATGSHNSTTSHTPTRGSHSQPQQQQQPLSGASVPNSAKSIGSEQKDGDGDSVLNSGEQTPAQQDDDQEQVAADDADN